MRFYYNDNLLENEENWKKEANIIYIEDEKDLEDFFDNYYMAGGIHDYIEVGYNFYVEEKRTFISKEKYFEDYEEKLMFLYQIGEKEKKARLKNK